MDSTEASDIIHNIIIAYLDSFDSNLSEEDREWNRIQYEELRDKVVDLLSNPLKEEYEKEEYEND
jgi:hypothetical protein